MAMEKPASEKVATNIAALAKDFIHNESNANNFIDILEFLEADKDPVVILAAIKASCKVCCYLISKSYWWLVPAGAKLAPKSSTQSSDDISVDMTERYREWMKDNYLSCTGSLQQLMRHSDSAVREASLSSLMKLVRTEGHTHQRLGCTYFFPNTFFHCVVSVVLSSDDDMCTVIDQFHEYLTFDDVRFYWLKNIASIILTKVERAEELKVSEVFVINVRQALKIVTMPHSEKELCNFWSGNISQNTAGSESDEDDLDGGRDSDMEDKPPKLKRSKMKVKALRILTLWKHKKHFSDAWLAFLRLPLSSKLYKKVLSSLHSDVMPHLLDPRLLLDFLTDSYDAGGVVSLLALNGLFILMHEYHLDYPEFFKKLYSLLKPSVFEVKYRKRFFTLLNTFLLSTHLPLYLVAAFVKRLGRLALTAPPSGVMVAVVLIVILLKRHPNCRVLVHRKNLEENGVSYDQDPYDMTQEDPANSNALESSLWELRTLESHFLPAVSKLVKDVLTAESIFSGTELDLDKYLDIDEDQLFMEACAMTKDTVSGCMNEVDPTSLWKPREL